MQVENEKTDGVSVATMCPALQTQGQVCWPSWGPRFSLKQRSGPDGRDTGRILWIVGSTDRTLIHLFHSSINAWSLWDRLIPDAVRASLPSRCSHRSMGHSFTPNRHVMPRVLQPAAARHGKTTLRIISAMPPGRLCWRVPRRRPCADCVADEPATTLSTVCLPRAP
jgi:hypothetical protein